MAIVDFKRDTRISNEHRSILREFCSELGGDPVKLAISLGLKVFLEKMGDDQDGGLVYDPALGSETGFAIVVNQSKPIHRRKFTIAHEIGHFVLHRKEPEFLRAFAKAQPVLKSHKADNVIPLPVARRASMENRATGSGFAVNYFSRRLEVEADRFAAVSLLPAYQLRRSPEFMNGEPVRLARRLDLSTSMVVRRFEEVEFE